MNQKYFILQGGAEHLRFFQASEAYLSRQQWFWIVTKSAQKGDIGFVYLCAPVSRIVGQVEFLDDPFYNTITFPRWANNWMTEIGNVRYFEPRPELTIKGLKPLFPDWAWLRYPRGKTQIPAEILQPFLDLIKWTKKQKH